MKSLALHYLTWQATKLEHLLHLVYINNMLTIINFIVLLPRSVFGSVVVVAFQSVFHSEKYANNVFLFFKNYFWDQHIKMIWKHQKQINSKQKKKFKFFRKRFWKALPNALLDPMDSSLWVTVSNKLLP